jgi:two-component system KDP operon response regulator KdpE
VHGKRILIVEDDAFIRRAIELTFRKEGADVFNAVDGESALQMFYQHRPDLVILDILLPGMDGWETIRLMHRLADTPVIMLTSLQDEGAMVRGLDLGAVDFITKPFSPKVLLARSRAALRQSGSSREGDDRPAFDDGYLYIDLAQHQVRVKGELIGLTKTEYRLLNCLVEKDGQVVSFEEILDDVWGPGYEDCIDYVHVYMSRLRRKLEINPRQPRYFHSEHGVGYRFVNSQ